MRSLTHRRGTGGALLAALIIAIAVPRTVDAQDFLFDRPDMTISLYGGWTQPAESGDLFEFTREHLTVEAGAFDSPVAMAEVAWRANERLDLGVGLEHTSRSVASEMRDWVTADDLPITQTTRFSRTRFMATARGYLLPRGREISRYSWVPYRWSPYVGAGAGVSHFEFVQTGDFVNVDTQDIFDAELGAAGDGLSAHALAGIQVSLTPRFLLRGEYQYVWGDAPVGPNDRGMSDFEGFGDVDLSGWRGLIGVSVRM